MAIIQTPKLSQDAESILTYMSATKDAMERHKRKIKSACHLSDATRADKAFADLLSSGYITDAGDGILDLTEPGLQLAHSLKKPKTSQRNVTKITNNIHGVEGGTVNMTGIENGVMATPLNYESLINPPTVGKLVSTPVKPRDIDDEPEILRTRRTEVPDVPLLEAHPMRNGLPATPVARGAKPVQPKAIAVRFVLAFDLYRNALPVPIVHGDILGRSKKNSAVTLVISHDEYVSNKHCKFEVTRDRATNRPTLYVEDLGSRNGTFVDDIEVYEGKMQAPHGSRLRIGNTTFVVVEIPY